MTRFESKLRHLFSFLFFSFLFFSFLFLFLLSFALNFAHVCVRVSALRLVLQLLQLSWVRGVSIDLWVNFYQIWTNLLTPPNVAAEPHISARQLIFCATEQPHSAVSCVQKATHFSSPELAHCAATQLHLAVSCVQGATHFSAPKLPQRDRTASFRQSQYHLWRAPR